MAAEKSLAIVLRVIEFSETSCVVTLFTRDFGKISALAKGARRRKSPFEAALDLLNVCRVVFLHKSSDSLDLLTEAKLERRFRAAAGSLSRLYAGYYVAELLKELTDEGDPHSELYDVAEETLQALDGEGDVVREVLRFELITLRLLGSLPSLDHCVGCGRAVEGSGRAAFGLIAGGVLCSECRIGKRGVASVRREVIELLKQFAAPDDQSWRTAPVIARHYGELRGMLNNYLAHLIGKRPKMHQYLTTLAD